MDGQTYSIIRAHRGEDASGRRSSNPGSIGKPRARKQSNGTSENVSPIRQRRTGRAISPIASWKAPLVAGNSRGKHDSSMPHPARRRSFPLIRDRQPQTGCLF
jgi:hypothetical protein